MSIFYKNLEVKDTATKGKGLFSKCSFAAGEVVLEFAGNIVERKDLPYPYPDTKEVNYLKQISKDKYLSISGEYDDYINHSCNPNCAFSIKGQRAFLIALYDIKPNTELNFDYSITSNDPPQDWSMTCNCGDYSCRKFISGYHSLPEDKKKEYEKLKIIPSYVKV